MSTRDVVERGRGARRRDQVEREKTSQSLRSDVVHAAKALVQAGHADNLSAFVEAAVQEQVRRIERAALYAAYESAAQDTEFQQSMAEVTREFSASDLDGL